MYVLGTDAGKLCLHHAVQNGAPLAVVAALCSACPESVKVGDEQGRLPLHCLSEVTSAAVVRHLVKLHSRAATACLAP